MLQRAAAVTRMLCSSTSTSSSAAATTYVLMVDRDGNTDQIYGNVGDTLFDLVAKGTDMAKYLDCACAGKMLCSTCHVYVLSAPKNMKGPSEEEQDMLDIAYEPTEQSRLGCQIRLPAPSEGILKVQQPGGTVNHFR